MGRLSWKQMAPLEINWSGAPRPQTVAFWATSTGGTLVVQESPAGQGCEG